MPPLAGAPSVDWRLEICDDDKGDGEGKCKPGAARHGTARYRPCVWTPLSAEPSARAPLHRARVHLYQVHAAPFQLVQLAARPRQVGVNFAQLLQLRLCLREVQPHHPEHVRVGLGQQRLPPLYLADGLGAVRHDLGAGRVPHAGGEGEAGIRRHGAHVPEVAAHHVHVAHQRNALERRRIRSAPQGRLPQDLHARPAARGQVRRQEPHLPAAGRLRQAAEHEVPPCLATRTRRRWEKGLNLAQRVATLRLHHKYLRGTVDGHRPVLEQLGGLLDADPDVVGHGADAVVQVLRQQLHELRQIVHAEAARPPHPRELIDEVNVEVHVHTHNRRHDAVVGGRMLDGGQQRLGHASV
mmetsp:Transcript_69798/g.217846  ORF Transcript_69798/g.217846 Transcript_69798/m.217846 type:complete len:354 (-) Transcript_69798:131-1192(-)